MKCLTIREPWATAIQSLGKNVENRSWPTRFRGRILIHASKKIDFDACRQLDVDPAECTTGAMVGSVEIIDCVRDSNSFWADPNFYHWILARPEKFRNPIPCRGHLSLWEFPLALLTQSFSNNRLA